MLRKKWLSDVGYDITLALDNTDNYFAHAKVSFTLKDFKNAELSQVFLNFGSGQHEWICDELLLVLDGKEYELATNLFHKGNRIVFDHLRKLDSQAEGDVKVKLAL